jgi:hypothetical protein
MTHWSLSNVLFSFQLFVCFLLLFLLLSSSINPLWSDRMQGVIFIFLFLLRLALCPKIWSILEKVLWDAEKKMYIVLLLNKIYCRHQLDPFDLWCHLVLRFLCWFFCLNDLSIVDRGVLKSPTTTVLESICAFKSFSVCLMKLGTLKLSVHRLMIVISFWCIALFISMKCPSLSYLTNVSLKSTLSDISTATPAYFQGPLAW